MALNETVVDGVANANFKTMAEQVASNQAAHSQRLQILAEKALAKSLESMDNTSVAEGLGAAIAASVGFQQAGKVAQTTPPVTA